MYLPIVDTHKWSHKFLNVRSLSLSIMFSRFVYVIAVNQYLIPFGGGVDMTQWVKLLLAMVTSCIRVPVGVPSLCFQSTFLLMHLGRQWRMAQEFGLLPSMWEARDSFSLFVSTALLFRRDWACSRWYGRRQCTAFQISEQ